MADAKDVSTPHAPEHAVTKPSGDAALGSTGPEKSKVAEVPTVIESTEETKEANVEKSEQKATEVGKKDSTEDVKEDAGEGPKGDVKEAVSKDVKEVVNGDAKEELREEPKSKELDDTKPAEVESNPEGDSKENGGTNRNPQSKNRGNNRKPFRQRGIFFNDPSEYHKNVKSQLLSQTESDDPDAIRKQVEFYFSDSNLYGDQYLFGLVEGHKNVPVEISKIHSFKRMRHFQPYSAIVNALKESTFLDVVDEDKVKRKIPVPEDLHDKSQVEIRRTFENKTIAKSVYAKGFGLEKPTSQFDIEKFFSQFGKTNQVRLRRTEEKIFKGSVFVEFDTEELAEDFLALDPPPKYLDTALLIKSKKQYCDEKVEEIESGKLKPRSETKVWKARQESDRRQNHNDRTRGGRGGRGRGGRDGRGFGRGGTRGRGGRDRDGPRNRNEEKAAGSQVDENKNIQTKESEPASKVSETKEPEPTKAPQTSGDVTVEPNPKKRTLEAVDGDSEQGKQKRVATGEA